MLFAANTDKLRQTLMLFAASTDKLRNELTRAEKQLLFLAHLSQGSRELF